MYVQLYDNSIGTFGPTNPDSSDFVTLRKKYRGTVLYYWLVSFRFILKIFVSVCIYLIHFCDLDMCTVSEFKILLKKIKQFKF